MGTGASHAGDGEAGCGRSGDRRPCCVGGRAAAGGRIRPARKAPESTGFGGSRGSAGIGRIAWLRRPWLQQASAGHPWPACARSPHHRVFRHLDVRGFVDAGFSMPRRSGEHHGREGRRYVGVLPERYMDVPRPRVGAGRGTTRRTKSPCSGGPTRSWCCCPCGGGPRPKRSFCPCKGGPIPPSTGRRALKEPGPERRGFDLDQPAWPWLVLSW